MKAQETDRGFVIVAHEKHQVEPVEMARIIQESSAIGTYSDAVDNPGSSYLWIGQHHHLNREEVGELINRLQFWLKNKQLEIR